MTLHLDDARWRSAIDAALRGEATPEQHDLIAQYEPQSDEHRAEAAFLAGLAAPPPVRDEPTPAWLETAVDVYVTTSAETGKHDAVVRSRRWPWITAAAGLALAIGGTFAALGHRPTPRTAESFQVAALAEETAPETRSETDAHPTSPWQIASGSARLTDTLPVDEMLTVESELCAERRGHSVCADAGARVTARGSGALALHEGTATIRSEEDHDVRVEFDEVTVHAAAHSVVVVERRVAGWSVAVESGSATVTELGSARRLDAGERLERGEAERDRVPTLVEPGTKRVASPSTLLGRARVQRREGDTRGAMKTYAELIRQHPSSTAAQTARMSLAQLHLDQDAPKEALRLFRAYGKRGGPLAEDAAYGEIRALRSLGRASEADRAVDAFARRYPNSPYGAKLEP